jgi:hypothetical protein
VIGSRSEPNIQPPPLPHGLASATARSESHETARDTPRTPLHAVPRLDIFRGSGSEAETLVFFVVAIASLWRMPSVSTSTSPFGSSV